MKSIEVIVKTPRLPNCPRCGSRLSHINTRWPFYHLWPKKFICDYCGWEKTKSDVDRDGRLTGSGKPRKPSPKPKNNRWLVYLLIAGFIVYALIRLVQFDASTPSDSRRDPILAPPTDVPPQIIPPNYVTVGTPAPEVFRILGTPDDGYLQQNSDTSVIYQLRWGAIDYSDKLYDRIDPGQCPTATFIDLVCDREKTADGYNAPTRNSYFEFVNATGIECKVYDKMHCK